MVQTNSPTNGQRDTGSNEYNCINYDYLLLYVYTVDYKQMLQMTTLQVTSDTTRLQGWRWIFTSSPYWTNTGPGTYYNGSCDDGL